MIPIYGMPWPIYRNATSSDDRDTITLSKARITWPFAPMTGAIGSDTLRTV